MASLDSIKISIQQFYTNTAMAQTSNSPAVVTKFTQFFILQHTKSHTVFVIVSQCTGTLVDVHLFFGGIWVQKLLGACKYTSLTRMLQASDRTFALKREQGFKLI